MSDNRFPDIVFRHKPEPERGVQHAWLQVSGKCSDTVGEITIRRKKLLVLRIMVEQGRTMVLFLSELVSRCEQIFPHRCCFQPVRRIRQQCPIVYGHPPGPCSKDSWTGFWTGG